MNQNLSIFLNMIKTAIFFGGGGEGDLRTFLSLP